MKIRLKNTLSGLLLGLFTLPALAADSIDVEEPFARAVPPGVTNSAAFMLLKNPSDKDRRLIAASSDLADKVELHTHRMDNGVMRMRQVAEIVVPANGQTVLQPGGYHVMFLGLKRAVKPGDSVTVTLHFANGEAISVGMTAQKMAPHMKHGGHHHH